MEAARTRWSDERIDDFAKRLDRFEERVDDQSGRFASRLDSLVQAIILAMTSIVAVMIAQIIFG